MIQSYDSTYTTIDKKEMEDYNQWLNQLSKPEMFKEASELLKTNSVIHYEYFYFVSLMTFKDLKSWFPMLLLKVLFGRIISSIDIKS